MTQLFPLSQLGKKFRKRPILSISTIVLISIGSLIVIHKESVDIIHRLLSSASYEPCDVFSITLPSQPIVPVYAASYPGSGSQMTHYLFEAITGLEAGDEHLHRGDTYDRITIKTHYPARPHNVAGNRLMRRAILLIRNPLHSIPSYHNYLYENENGIPDHTVKAPVSAWLKWRDEHVEEEIRKWMHHAAFWMGEFNKNDRLVVAYERLTDEKMGPIESARISNFLGRQEGVEVISPSSMPCVWDKVVNYNRVDIDDKGRVLTRDEVRVLVKDKSDTPRHLYNEHGEKQNDAKTIVKRRVKYVSHEDPTHPGNSKRQGSQEYPFNLNQLMQVRTMLNALRGKFLNEYTFVVIVSGYIEEVNAEIKKLEITGKQE